MGPVTLLLGLLIWVCSADRMPLIQELPAMAGRDVVAFQQGLPEGSAAVPGDKQFAYNFSGFQFWFRNKENRDHFIADPWRFIPAYGGYGAYGVCCDFENHNWRPDFMGPTSGIDVGWNIINGRLYLNQYEPYQQGFLKSVKDNIEAGDRVWMSWWGRLYGGPMNVRCYGGHDHHDVPEDFCNVEGETGYDYHEYQVALETSLLDDNYFKVPQFDCNYVVPPAGSSPPNPPLTTVTPPSPCAPPDPPSPPKPIQDNTLIYKVALVAVGGACLLGVAFGVGFYFWKKGVVYKLVASDEAKGRANLSESEDLSIGDGSDITSSDASL